MRILLSGSTGLIGTAAARTLREQGHDVVPLSRRHNEASRSQPATTPANAVSWDPATGALGDSADGADAVVHLGGASIAGHRWTPARKKVLIESRVDVTRKLVAALGRLSRPPRIFVSASAIGYYGNRGEESLNEESAPGNDFLASICREWEAESSRARDFGARVAMLRFGIVLAKQGGALKQMLPPFRLGLGGPIGSGKQWMSWIALEDVTSIIAFAISNDQVAGPVNAVAPNPVRNAEFTRELGRALHRPAVLPAPPFALRIAFGEMADSLLLTSQRVLPQKLAELRYLFQQADLGRALASILNGHS